MLIVIIALVVIIVVLVVGTLVQRRRGYSGIGGDTIVRCRDGHVFTTIWVPGVSLKAVRLGSKRYQRCPVGRHWTTVTPIRDSDLTDEDRRSAAEYHDLRIP